MWTAAFAAATVGVLNLISVAFAVLFIGLCVDFGIHYGLRYCEAARDGLERATASALAAASVGPGLALAALAAGIGFLSFLPTDYLGLAELGLIAGAGMAIGFFATLTLLPAFMTVLRARAGSTGGGGRFAEALAACSRAAPGSSWRRPRWCSSPPPRCCPGCASISTRSGSRTRRASPCAR